MNPPRMTTQEVERCRPGYSPVDTYEEAQTACVSPGHAEFLWWMIEAEKDLRPLMEEEEQAIAASTEGIAPIFPRE